MSQEIPARFQFATCQFGAEQVCKAEVLARFPFLAFAFSRPGFLTFKIAQPVELAESFCLVGTFVRTAGWSLESIQGTHADVVPRVRHWLAAQPFQQIHVWPRDTATPGDHEFEPGTSPESLPLANAIEQSLAQENGDDRQAPRVNVDASYGEHVLDVIQVDPGVVWLGRHVASTVPGRWPGGVPQFARPESMISRAYLKTREAIAWSRFPLQPGDWCLEIGAAPGGSCQALLEAGLRVIAVDPAAMSPALQQNANLVYFRGRSRDIRRGKLRPVRWLLADLNMAPNYTLDAVTDIVTNAKVNLEGMLLTLKLAQWELSAQIPEYVARVKALGFDFVRTRQLAFNRREICVAALRDKSMRVE